MNSDDCAIQIKHLISQSSQKYSAIHGTSIGFVEQLLNNGQIYQEGNFDNYLYVLVPVDTKGVDIIESATYYANINAIKDLLFSQNHDLHQKVIKNIDQYLFTTGLGQIMDNPDKTNMVGFEIFTSTEIDSIKKAIYQAKSEDRRGLIVYFNNQFQKDFQKVDQNEQGQVKVSLSQPLALKHISYFQPLGNYEKSSLN